MTFLEDVGLVLALPSASYLHDLGPGPALSAPQCPPLCTEVRPDAIMLTSPYHCAGPM